mmetsp:Transcript_15125/g.45819  ORF Transcript_15125/g.45819 Transcript_15125/m.45819 type:complete len:410 (+) Transcript_15125:134-1363(+)
MGLGFPREAQYFCDGARQQLQQQDVDARADRRPAARRCVLEPPALRGRRRPRGGLDQRGSRTDRPRQLALLLQRRRRARRRARRRGNAPPRSRGHLRLRRHGVRRLRHAPQRLRLLREETTTTSPEVVLKKWRRRQPRRRRRPEWTIGTNEIPAGSPGDGQPGERVRVRRRVTAAVLLRRRRGLQSDRRRRPAPQRVPVRRYHRRTRGDAGALRASAAALVRRRVDCARHLEPRRAAPHERPQRLEPHHPPQRRRLQRGPHRPQKPSRQLQGRGRLLQQGQARLLAQRRQARRHPRTQVSALLIDNSCPFRCVFLRVTQTKSTVLQSDLSLLVLRLVCFRCVLLLITQKKKHPPLPFSSLRVLNSPRILRAFSFVLWCLPVLVFLLCDLPYVFERVLRSESAMHEARWQ